MTQSSYWGLHYFNTKMQKNRFRLDCAFVPFWKLTVQCLLNHSVGIEDKGKKMRWRENTAGGVGKTKGIDRGSLRKQWFPNCWTMLQAYAEVNYLRFCQCPHFSASEVTTLRCYTNLFIIIILSRFLSIPTVWCSKAQPSAILLFAVSATQGVQPANGNLVHKWQKGLFWETQSRLEWQPAGVTVVN